MDTKSLVKVTICPPMPAAGSQFYGAFRLRFNTGNLRTISTPTQGRSSSTHGRRVTDQLYANTNAHDKRVRER